ncbi:DNA-binding HxlR family transcriptional regulator [Thermocatellispora tengchongensis]|uniref:DNA-binding HxlR family transcriptional regulator n=1 Tax=Thermocatellispora tengchongensis TaxID=1073253 RepID=A0A840PQY3_9ACTN|nr:helix-turn-helix domain-containing protein [Thermocatellispora tengchongensis]MBB5139497.1 DNA-binding HxlR family transcriptional regulator [Thermocatellispora tengchongensis]
MVKRTRLDDSDCPVARSVDTIGDWWSLLIVRDAFDGSRRFGQFQRSLGVAKNILAARLRALVAAGIFEVVPAADGSAYQEYVLTPKGRDLFPVIVALRQWGETHSFTPGEPHSRLVDRLTGRPLAPLRVEADDGRAVEPGDTVVIKVDRESPRAKSG